MTRARPHPTLILAVFALTAIAWICGLAGSAPEVEESAPQAIETAAEAEPSGGGALATPTLAAPGEVDAPQPAILESRRLTLEFPPQIRQGDSDLIRLTLEADDLGNLTPTALIEGNVLQGETVSIPNLYDTHNVIAEARLDLAGAQVSPPDVISEPLQPGQTVTFLWSVRPEEQGRYRGVAWLHLQFVDRVTGEASRTAVSAQPVDLEVVNLLGFSTGFVRGAGVVGSVIGGILGFPFLDDLLKLVFRRRKG